VLRGGVRSTRQAGVQTAVVSLADLDRIDGAAAVERSAPIIVRFA